MSLTYKKIFAVILILLLSSFIAFGTSLCNGFFIDDYSLIVNNMLIKNLKFIPQIFSQPFLTTCYRPLAVLSFAADYFVWKLNPFGYHLTNILLHFANAVLFFFLLYLIFKNTKISIMASILFTIHPLNSIPVNYISDRVCLLAAFFMLCALIALCLGYNKNKIQFYCLGFIFFIASLLCHENAVLFPFYLSCIFLVIPTPHLPARDKAGQAGKTTGLPMDECEKNASSGCHNMGKPVGCSIYKKGAARQIVILFLIALSISLFYLLLRLKYLSLASKIFLDPNLFFSLKSIFAFSYIIFKYFLHAVFPHNICLSRVINQNIISSYEGVLYMFLVILSILFVLIKFRRNKIMLFACGWFFVGLLPLYHLMFYRPITGLIMLDYYIYFSSIGLFIIISVVFIHLERLVNRKLFIIFLCLVFLFYADRSIANNALWKDEKTYCLYWLDLTPRNPVAICTLANYYADNKDYEKANYYLKKGIDSLINAQEGNSGQDLFNKKRLSMFFNSLGAVLSKQSNLEQAAEYYRKAITLNPDNAIAHFNLGNVNIKKNNMDMAIFHFKEAIKRDFYYLNAHYNLALIYARMGNDEKAFEEIKIALYLDPDCFTNR